MPTSFKVYIDESGDDGFVFRPNAAGSSEWFVLSAIVIRYEKDFRIVESMKATRKLLHRKENAALHFSDMVHTKRLAWIQAIAKCPLRCLSVLVHKPLIGDVEVFGKNAFHLYRYSTRLLLERVSWLCREEYQPGKGDGIAEIVFSNRRRMSYQQIRDYLTKLKNSSNKEKVRIDWNHIDPNRIRSVNHDQLAGLQIADCIASAHWQAVTLDRFGNCEPRYLNEVRKLLFRFKGTVQSYGLKFWPSIEELRPSKPHLSFFDGL